jgi:hypothetical protein
MGSLMGRSEDEIETFDDLIWEREFEKALEYIEGEAGAKPWKNKLRGCLSFAYLVVGRKALARLSAFEVLALDPYDEWASSTMFAVNGNFVWDGTGAVYEGKSRLLDPIWILRLDCLGFEECARVLIGLILLYGSQESRERVRMDILEYGQKHSE